MMKERFRYHESAHAVIALATGLKFSFVASFGDKGVCLLETLTEQKTKDPDFRRRYLLATVAGAVGEGIRFGNNPLFSLDNGMGQTDMKNLATMGYSLPDILQGCLDVTTYLQNNWQAVEAVASGLQQFPVMFVEQVQAAAGELPDPLAKPKATAASQPTYASKAEVQQIILQHCHNAPASEWISWWGNESAVIKAVA